MYSVVTSLLILLYPLDKSANNNTFRHSASNTLSEEIFTTSKY